MADPNNEKVTGGDKSVPKFNTVKSSSDEQGAREHGYVRSVTTRSGHAYVTGDVDGKEFILMQHRSGSGWVYNSDGSAKMVIKNGFYSEIQGEYRMQTTGDYDIRSEQHASLRTEGNYSITSHTTSMTSHDGTHIGTGGNFRMVIGQQTHLVTNGLNIHSTGSPVYIGGAGPTTITGANLALNAKKKGGGLASLGGSQVSLRAEDLGLSMSAAKGISVTADGDDIRIHASGGNVYINSGPGTKPENVNSAETKVAEAGSEIPNPVSRSLVG